MNTKSHTDIKSDHFILKYAPDRMRSYILLSRLDRPIGIWLLLLPGLWSITLATPSLKALPEQWATYVLFGFGAIIMRAAGCIINDLWDRDLDRQVLRTRHRPLASGVIPPRRAIIFLAVLLFLSLLILLQFNTTTIILGLTSLPFIAIYPLMKRITWWPQAFLGLTFNFGALMGWSAVTGALNWPAFFLYGSGIFWTLGYDTIYAHQDKDDDALVGIKSTALKFGPASPLYVAVFYGLSWALLLISTAAYTQIQNVLIFTVPLLHLIWQIYIWNPDQPDSALRVFKSNQVYGLLVLGTIVLAA